MPRNYIKKRPDPAYTLDDLSKAVFDIQNKNCTYREASDIYSIPVSVIYNRIAGRKNALNKVGQGRGNALIADIEDEIGKCLVERSRMGYPCDREELRFLVGEYVQSCNLVTPFKNGVPGYDWYYAFMKRHPRLSLKKPEHLQKVRKTSRKPELIYDFYNKLNDLLKDSNILGEDKASFVFNADESGFCSDPNRLRGIGEKGQALSRVSGGSGRESTTVLACVSADGSALPPLIIFKGAAVQARWTSNEAIPGTLYGASQNIDGEIIINFNKRVPVLEM